MPQQFHNQANPEIHAGHGRRDLGRAEGCVMVYRVSARAAPSLVVGEH